MDSPACRYLSPPNDPASASGVAACAGITGRAGIYPARALATARSRRHGKRHNPLSAVPIGLDSTLHRVRRLGFYLAGCGDHPKLVRDAIAEYFFLLQHISPAGIANRICH